MVLFLDWLQPLSTFNSHRGALLARVEDLSEGLTSRRELFGGSVVGVRRDGTFKELIGPYLKEKLRDRLAWTMLVKAIWDVTTQM